MLTDYVVCNFSSLQTCVEQIFDTREVNVTMNQLLVDEFSINMKAIFQYLEGRIGEGSEKGREREG